MPVHPHLLLEKERRRERGEREGEKARLEQSKAIFIILAPGKRSGREREKLEQAGQSCYVYYVQWNQFIGTRVSNDTLDLGITFAACKKTPHLYVRIQQDSRVTDFQCTDTLWRWREMCTREQSGCPLQLTFGMGVDLREVPHRRV